MHDDSLASAGARRLDWVRSRMPLLRTVRERFTREQPFAKRTIGVSLHLDPKTGVLLETLAAGGATIVATGNYGSTQDDIVAALAAHGMTVYGHRADPLDVHLGNVARVMAKKPDILLDNGADLCALVANGSATHNIVGCAEETTSGGERLRGEFAGKLPFPIIVINDSALKAIGENMHAVGRSTLESFVRLTGLMVNGRRVVVYGYGWCGRGIAHAFAALGARIAVIEIDPIKRLEAALDGYRVGTIADFGAWADVIITATGVPGVLAAKAIATLRSGAILANAGHFPFEIDVAGLRASATTVSAIRDDIERFTLPGGAEIDVLTGGRMVNLGGANALGNSIESMDLGFMLQALSLERVGQPGNGLHSGAQGVPLDIEHTIANAMVEAMGASR